MQKQPRSSPREKSGKFFNDPIVVLLVTVTERKKKKQAERDTDKQQVLLLKYLKLLLCFITFKSENGGSIYKNVISKQLIEYLKAPLKLFNLKYTMVVYTCKIYSNILLFIFKQSYGPLCSLGLRCL